MNAIRRPRRCDRQTNLTRARRTRLEALIETLIAALDQFDGDADLEPEPDEDSPDREWDLAELGEDDGVDREASIQPAVMA